MGAMTSKTRNYYIHTLITLVLMFSGWFLPTMFGLPEAGMKALGIFLGMLWGWIFVEFGWVSIFGVIMLGMIGVITVPAALLLAFGSDTFLQLFFSMAFVIYMDKCGFAAWFSKWLLRLPFLNGHPWRIIGAYLLLGAILSIAINPFAVFFLVAAFFRETAVACGYQKGDLVVGYVIAGIMMMQTISGMLLPFKSYPVMIQGILGNMGSVGVPFMGWLSCALIGWVYQFVGYMFIGKFILRLDVSKLKNLPESVTKGELGKLTFDMKIGLGVMAAFVFILTGAALFPAGAVKNFLNGFGLQGTALLMIAFLLMIRKPDGSRLVTSSELINGVAWDVLFLVTSTLTLSSVFRMPEVGILNAVTTGLLPYVQGFSPTMFMIVICLLFWAVTQVTHNYVIVLVLVGALANVFLGMGMNPWAFAFVFATVCNFAYATPAASSPAALFYADDWTGKKNAYICGIAFSCLAIPYILFMTPISIMLMGSF